MPKITDIIRTKTVKIGGITWTIREPLAYKELLRQTAIIDMPLAMKKAIEHNIMGGGEIDPNIYKDCIKTDALADGSHFTKILDNVISWDVLNEDDTPMELTEENLRLVLTSTTLKELNKAVDDFSKVPTDDDLKN